MRRFTFIIMFLAFCLSAFTQALTPDQKKALDRANMAKEIAQQSNTDEDWTAAIDEYKKAIDLMPDYAPVYYELGMVYKKIHDYDKAVSTLKKYLILEPNSSYKDQIMTDINKMDYLKDRNKNQVKENENLKGLWATLQKVNGTIRPFWIFNIDEFNGELRVSINPKSAYYQGDFTYPTAIALKKGSKVNFMFTTDATTDIKNGLNQASDALNATDMVVNYVNPLNNLPFGVAGNVLGMVPASGPKSEKTQFVFSVDISNPERIIGKVNIKKYVIAEKGIKVTSDEIKDVELSKFTNIDLAAISDKKLYKANSYRNPGSAFCLSFIFPGGGQYYNKQPLKGAIITTCVLSSIAGIIYVNGYAESMDDPTLFIVLGGAFYLYSVFDAPITANKINKENGFALGKIYENNKYCLNLRPEVIPFCIAGKYQLSSGLCLTLKFK